MSLNERIIKVIKYSNLTPSEFADKIDVQRSSISHIMSGRNKPSLEFIIKIKSHFPELLWDWLVTGEGEMLNTQLFETEINENTTEKEKIKTIPLSNLFTMINDEFGSDKTEEAKSLITNSEKTVIPQSKDQEKTLDSQQLENSNKQILCQIPGNQTNNIKRIVLLYENGKFESFEP